MKRIALLVAFILVISCFATGFTAYTFDTEYLSESGNVSVLYNMTFNNYSYSSHGTDCVSSAFYKSFPVTFSNLTVEEKIAIVGSTFLANEGTAIYDDNGRLPLSHFQKEYKRLFGQTLQYEENVVYPYGKGSSSFTFSGDDVIYDFPKPWEDDAFEPSLIDVRGIFYVEKYVMNGDKLYIYDKYALVRVSEAKDGKVPVYSSSDSVEPIGYLDYDIETDKCEFEDALDTYYRSLRRSEQNDFYTANYGTYFSDDVDIAALSEYEDLLTEYVHTFERDGDGNWYWVSSSPADLMPEIPDTADNSYWAYFAVMMAVVAAAVVIRNRRKA